MITKTEFSNCPDFLEICMGRKENISTYHWEELRSNLTLLNSSKFVFSASTPRFHVFTQCTVPIKFQVNAVVLFKGIYTEM